MKAGIENPAGGWEHAKSQGYMSTKVQPTASFARPPRGAATPADHIPAMTAKATEERTAVRDYNFPGTPYPQQQQLMDALYDAMQNRNVGLFESPTGTGKTLSIICAVSTFLRDQRHADITPPPLFNIADDWVSAHAAQKEREERRHHAREQADRRRARVNRLTTTKPASITSARARRYKRKRPSTKPTDDDGIYLLEDIPDKVEESFFSDDSVDDKEEDEERPPPPRDKLPVRPLRVIFATRTHSQLAQFAAEFRRTSHGAAALQTTTDADAADHIGAVLFGSRKHMCVHEGVRALGSSTAINERCRELNESRSTVSSGAKRTRAPRAGCPHRADRNAERSLRDRALAHIHAPSELEEAAKTLGACPYYAARAAIDSHDADVVAVPYAALLHAPTRRALGLSVDADTIVVFDEAHNLVSAVCDLNASTLSQAGLTIAKSALLSYTQRYKDRLTPNNLFHLRQLAAVATGLSELLTKQDADGKPRVVPPAALIFEASVDNVNLYALVEFMTTSKLSNKLRGFVHINDTDVSSNQKQSEADRRSAASRAAAAISSFDSFLAAIADCPRYARVAIHPNSARDDNGSRLKFFVLEPGALFADAVRDASSVLLLGGTLSPREAIRERLLFGLPHTVAEFECDHVVPASHVHAITVANAPCGRAIELTHRNRVAGGPALTDAIGKSLFALANEAPGGVIAFFTSYDALATAAKRWRATGALAALPRPSFFEKRAPGDDAFAKFAEAVRENPVKGALLGAVMGGRLSEGINFKDELGRLVVVVGMPFANAADPEMKETLAVLPGTRERAKLLQNACLTVVNQCVGRAVRHRMDYAAVVFLDFRYRRPAVQCLLPAFVRRSLSHPGNFAQAAASVRFFFSEREKNG